MAERLRHIRLQHRLIGVLLQCHAGIKGQQGRRLDAPDDRLRRLALILCYVTRRGHGRLKGLRILKPLIHIARAPWAFARADQAFCKCHGLSVKVFAYHRVKHQSKRANFQSSPAQQNLKAILSANHARQPLCTTRRGDKPLMDRLKSDRSGFCCDPVVRRQSKLHTTVMRRPLQRGHDGKLKLLYHPRYIGKAR